MPSNLSTTRRKRRRSPLLSSVLAIVLPAFIVAAVGYFFLDKISLLLGLPTEQTHGTIVLDVIPAEYEVWIDDRPANFRRRTAGSAASIDAEPGTYKLTLKRAGAAVSEQQVTVEAGRELRISISDQVAKQSRSDASRSSTASSQLSNASMASQGTLAEESDVEESDVESAKGQSAKDGEWNPSPPSFENEEIFAALRESQNALVARDSSGAQAALKSLYVSQEDHRLPSYHPYYAQVKGMHQLGDVLEEFKRELGAGLKSLSAGDAISIGSTQVGVVEVQSDGLVLRYGGKNQRFSAGQFPSGLEQALLDLNVPQSPQGNLIRAVGLATYPKPTDKLVTRVEELAADAVQGQAADAMLARILVDMATSQLPEAEGDNPPAANATADATNADAHVNGEAVAATAHEEGLEDDPNATHKFDRRLEGALGPIGSLFLMPDDVPIDGQTSLLGSGRSFQGTGATLVNSWDIRTGVRVAANALSGPLWNVACSANRRIFIAHGHTSQQTNLRVYFPPSPNPVFQTKALADSLSAISLSNDGRELCGVDADETFVRWNLQTRQETGRMVARKPLGRENVVALAVRSPGDLVAVAATDGSVRVWRTADGDEVAELVAPSFDATDKDHWQRLQFHRSQPTLAAIAGDGSVTLFDYRESNSQTERVHDFKIASTAISLNNRYAATADEQGNVRVWDVGSASVVASFNDPHASPISALSLDSTADFVAVGFEDSVIHLWKKK